MTRLHTVIYLGLPSQKGLKEYIETYAMEKYSFPIYCYSEIRGKW